LQNVKLSSQWQPPVDDEGDDSGGGVDFADACTDLSDDECGNAVVTQEQKPQVVGLQLVEAPKMAQRLDIGFARKAKRVDVKALKENLWSNLAPDGKKSTSTTFTSNFFSHCISFSLIVLVQASSPRSLSHRMLSLQTYQCRIVLSACCIYAMRRV
jgi:hypothetical protein